MIVFAINSESLQIALPDSKIAGARVLCDQLEGVMGLVRRIW